MTTPKDADKLNRLVEVLDELPVFPLPQVVFFPRALVPLHVFEPRYRRMLADALDTHSMLVIALIAEGAAAEDGRPALARVAGGGAIIEHQTLPNGRSNILVHGLARLEIEELPFVPPYRRVKAKLMSDIHAPVPAAERTALIAAAQAFAGEVHQRDPNFSFSLPPSLEPQAIADLCAHHLVVSAKARQRILEELDVLERVRLVTSEIAIQHGQLVREQGGVLH